MSLIDDLRELAEKVPPSHIPAIGEIQKIVGALLVFVEHGAPALAHDAQEISDLVGKATEQPPTEQPVAGTVAPAAVEAPPASAAATSPSPDVSALEAENEALRQQVQTLIAQEQRTAPEPPQQSS